MTPTDSVKATSQGLRRAQADGAGGGGRRKGARGRGRTLAPQRTEEELAELRRQRAEQRARPGALAGGYKKQKRGPQKNVGIWGVGG